MKLRSNTCSLSLVASIGSALSLSFACSSVPEPEQQDLRSLETSLEAAEPTVGTVFSAELADGKVVKSGNWVLPSSAYGFEAPAYTKAELPALAAARPKIDGLLEGRLGKAEAAAAADETIDVVVTFKETLRVPRFPIPNEAEARSSATNQAAARQAEQLVSQIEQARAGEHARHASELRSQHGAKIGETFWLVNGMTAQVPRSQVRALAARADVEFVEENYKPITPPVNNSSDARALMSTDAFFNLGLTGGFIGLLDTGVRGTHTLLSRVSIERDCVNGTSSNCTVGVGLDPSDNFWNHGTCSASELTANTNLGNAHRGITGITVDSFKVYSNAGQVTAAVVRGFQAALAVLDRVIVAEVQDTGTETGSIAAAADAAFDAGAVVVAAAGNFGPGAGSVRSPGRAHKTLAIGAVDVTSQALQGFSGRGPAADNRIKPDLTGPTNVNAASNASDTALTLFGGTSAATPNAAGAAALIRNFLRGTATNFPPGQVNAFMIMTGRLSGFDNNNGAGLVLLPTNGHLNWGSVSVTTGSVVNVPITVAAPVTFIETALWWPEGATQTHNDIDLRLVNPSGTVVASSTSVASIFETLRANTTVAGTWNIRISSFNVTGTQTVFWSFFKHI